MRSIDKVLIIGMTESGKTELAKHLLRTLIPRYVVYDCIGNFTALPGAYYYTDLASINWQNDKIVFQPFRTPDNEDTLEAICKLALERGQNRMFVCDELHGYQSFAHGGVPEMLNKLVKQGRNWGVGFIGATQRLTDINQTIRTSSKHIFLFFQQGKDLELIQESYGQDVSDAVAGLKRFEFIYLQLVLQSGEGGKMGYVWKKYPPLQLAKAL